MRATLVRPPLFGIRLWQSDRHRDRELGTLPPFRSSRALLVRGAVRACDARRVPPTQGEAEAMPFYAVARGHRPGVYSSWDDAKKQVERFPNARHKKFATEKDALSFVAENDGGARSGGGGEAAMRVEVPVPVPVPVVEPKAVNVRSVRRKLRESSKVEEAQGFGGGDGRAQDGEGADPNPRDSSTLVAFTDGSALGNGRVGSRAGWACVFPHNADWHRAEPLDGKLQTNNRAEYRAAIEAILRANVEDPAKVRPLYIYSDSMLLIRSMTEWISGWRARGWKKADKAPVLNSDLLKWLLKEQGGRRILWRHVPAHTNGVDWKSRWNDLADQMAKEQAQLR